VSVVAAALLGSCSGEVTRCDPGDSLAAVDATESADSAPSLDGVAGSDGATATDGGGGADSITTADGGGEITPPPGYPNLLFHDEFDSAPLSIGMQAGTTWAPGWIAWNTRHLSGNSDDCWKQHDGEEGWTSSWSPSGRTIGDALRSDADFVAAHGDGPYNHEVSDGTLKMRALRVPAQLRGTDFGGFEFTGGMISTEVNGWMEIRLRFTHVEQGMHFGFWTLSQDTKSWAADYGPEYDPLEVLYRNPAEGVERPERWHQNAIGIPTQPGQTGYPWPFYVEVPDYDAWHTVVLERGVDDHARFYIDGVLRREEDVSGKPQYRDENHFILSTWEIGGNWPGEVTSSDPNWYVEVEIDYIRVFGP